MTTPNPLLLHPKSSPLGAHQSVLPDQKQLSKAVVFPFVIRLPKMISLFNWGVRTNFFRLWVPDGSLITLSAVIVRSLPFLFGLCLIERAQAFPFGGRNRYSRRDTCSVLNNDTAKNGFFDDVFFCMAYRSRILSTSHCSRLFPGCKTIGGEFSGCVRTV